MKRLWIAVGILLAVAAVCVGALLWQLAAIDRLEAYLDAAEAAVRAGDAQALQKTEQFRQQCMQTAEILSFVSRHADSLSLRESASQLPSYVQQQEYDHFYSEAALCRFYLSELRKSEKPLAGNIF